MTQQPKMRLTDFTNTDLIVEQMGAGGFGLVFMGPNRTIGGEWRALKTLRPELLAMQPQLRDLFVSEGLTWVGLWPHPNLLTCETATEINGRVYLVLHYARYGSLRDLLLQNPAFSLRLAWAQHIAAGLLAIHTPDPELLRPQPLVHRDLKPENVLVQEQGYAQITDFGLAAAVGDVLARTPEAERAFALVEALAAQGAPGGGTHTAGKATRATRFLTRGGTGGAHGGMGTRAYMPPEQWRTDAEVGPPADLYAFGLILSELLAGRHGLGDLEEDRDADGWYQLHTQGRPRPLRTGPAESAAQLPAELETLYAALLAKDAADRPTAEEALAGLQRAARALGQQPYNPSAAVMPRTDHHRMQRWHNWSNTYIRFGRYEEALARSDRALALAPDEFNIWQTRGSILAALGRRVRQAGDEDQARRRLEEALTAYAHALPLAGSDLQRSAAHDGRASRLYELRRYAEADAAYAAALTVAPDYGVAWFNRALNAMLWGSSEAEAGRMADAARILAASERYVAEARRCGVNPSELPGLLARIQHARAQLKP